MTRDPILTCYVLAMFGLTVAGGAIQYSATAKLAKWLYQHQREVWRELGCPGTTFFKGEPDNGYLRRTSALQSMLRMMPLHAYRRQFGSNEAERYLQQHRLGGRLALIFMVLLGVGIFYGAARDTPRSPVPMKSDFIQGEPTAPFGGDKPSK